MTKFKVGDIVKGNNPSRYGITNSQMKKGEVVEVHSNGEIDIKIIEHEDKPRWIGETFPYLEAKYFELAKSEPFKVGDIVKGTKGSPYFITTDKMRKGLITRIHSDGDITVKVLEHDNSSNVGEEYPVKPEYFVLVEETEANKIKELEEKVATLEKKVEALELDELIDSISLPVPVSAPVPVVVDRTFKTTLAEGVSFEGTKEDFESFLSLLEEYMKRTEANKTYRF